ncbi:EamA family transporter [Rhizobium sp. TH2]|uniref:DMT family transporter n=1 Tax=Rhizobium sp. TH2 TaxID=2775403 RepID=UPI002156F82D|nr:DMT family transporter [Rhizobium sp. TH2]UVC09005.1 EamA family transporter [Rhizobium sp. TH2]
MQNDIRRGTIEMTAAMLISGTIGWFVLVSGQPVENVVFWRCAFGAVALIAICGALGYLKPGVITRRQLLIAVLGGIAIVSNWLLLFAAYPRSSISIATTVYNTQPFMLLGLGALFLGEKITLEKLAWLALAFGGMMLIVQAKPGGGATGGSYAIGILLALGAALFYALAAFAAKWLKGVPPHLVALVHVLTGVAMLAPFADFLNLPSDGQTWSLLATMGFVHTGVMYILLYGAIQRLPVHLTGALSFIYPVASIVVDRLAFGHLLQPVQMIGMALIFLAVAGMNFGLKLGIFRRAPTAP